MKLAFLCIWMVLSQIKCFDNFITRNADKLMDGPNEFRFISFNVPGLAVVGDPIWHLVDEWEQHDIYRSVSQLGGRAIRIYTFSIRKLSDTPDVKRHIYAPRKYDEDMFRCFDKMLELANKYRIRLIIPFIDQWPWRGGIDDFKAFRGAKNFYEDKRVREDFKDVITDILNRVNTYTGIKYKDDKAILAWETGNELSPTSSNWTSEIASHIKSVDQNHLVLDGKYGLDVNSLRDKNIDIVSNHYYPDIKLPYSERCKQDRMLSKGMKAFIIGEFGINITPNYEKLLDQVIDSGTSGALIWSLRAHNKNGGYYKHRETVQYWAYHWPGSEKNNGYDEINVMKLMREKAFKIQGKFIPSVPKPDPPILLDSSDVMKVNWKGSIGGFSYDIARKSENDENFEIIETDISDMKQVETEGPIFSDKTAKKGVKYYYRVRAKNQSGLSDWSNIIGPIQIY